MKKALLIIICVAGIFAACTSGKKQVNLDYVADMQINDTLTRTELVKLNIAIQREIFNTLTPEVKCELYRYKICKDLESGDFTSEEYREMEQLLDRIVPEIYTDRKEEFDDFGEQFVLKMANEFGWDEEKLFKYTMTIMTASEFEEYLSSMNIDNE